MRDFDSRDTNGGAFSSLSTALSHQTRAGKFKSCDNRERQQRFSRCRCRTCV